MKKFSVLLAIIALVSASLACQTLSGGGDNGAPEFHLLATIAAWNLSLQKALKAAAIQLVLRASFPCPTVRRTSRRWAARPIFKSR